MSTSAISTQFSGISDPTNYPPQNALAVGPAFALTAESSMAQWTSLSDESPVNQSLYTLFAPLGASATNALLDARAAFDAVNQRYVLIADNLGGNGTVSKIDIAVSKDANPNDGFYLGSLNTAITIHGHPTVTDMPYLSVDGANIYVTAPQYGTSGGFFGTETWVIGDKTGAGGGIYNGGALDVVANPLSSPSQGIMRIVADGHGKAYSVGAVPSGSDTVLSIQTYDVASNSFGAVTTLALGNSDTDVTATAQQLGTSKLLDAGDRRVQDLAYANGFLYGVNEVTPAGAAAPEVHWFKIDVSNPAAPVLAAQGDISGAAIGAGVATFDASIAVNSTNDVVINLTASGPNMYPADYYVYQAVGDDSFGAPHLYQASSGFFDSGDGAAVQRWGTYSTTVADNSQPHTFWLSSEYVANGWWQTSVARLDIAPSVSTSFYLHNNDGTFDFGQVQNGTVSFTKVGGYGPEWQTVGTGDYLGDGHTDVLLHNTTNGALTIAEVNSGQATFAQVGGYGNEWQALASDQFDASGNQDALLHNTQSGALVLASISNGQANFTQIGGFGNEWTTGTGTDAGGQNLKPNGLTGDILNDGRTGVVLHNTTTGAVVVAEDVNGSAQFTQVGAVGNEWQFLASGNFQNNGHTDLLLHKANTGALVLGEVVNGQLSYATVGGIGNEWQAAGAGDYLGDGHTGVLLHNASTGAVVEGELANGQMHYTQISGFGNDWHVIA